ncbi:MotA/TolQ/ExbB proton channel family protein [uncultured Vibrio sp.]|uniref:MotA/TolQ/ExbB proton channel family protein n=1 Tax=uncultured Vibrio sp. TaxID=114054 RepID=UPI002600B1DF|nr:MotA/TolQ/ExbB proton channel family protein [uncultured Vibrio sp.]
MNTFNAIHSQLGIMTWPLAVMSFLVTMLVLERAVFLLLNMRTQSKQLLLSVRQLDLANAQKVDAFADALAAKKRTIDVGAAMLLSHRHFDKTLREEAVSIWLQKQRQSYTSGLKILSIIGVIAPLVGLLGTVLGLIEMFKALGTSQGSIDPSLLAEGLGLAMSTTAAGLLIALPAITSAQLYAMWANNTLSKIEHGLNHCNLLLEGMNVGHQNETETENNASKSLEDSIRSESLNGSQAA